MENGFVKLFRQDLKLFDNEEYDRFHAYAYLVAKANIAPSKRYYAGQTISLARGQLVTSSESLARAFRWHDSRVRRTLKQFAKYGLIHCEAHGKAGTVITILNYDSDEVIGDKSNGMIGEVNPLELKVAQDFADGVIGGVTGEETGDTIKIKNEEIKKITSSSESDTLIDRLTDDEYKRLEAHCMYGGLDEFIEVMDRVDPKAVKHPYAYCVQVLKEKGRYID